MTDFIRGKPQKRKSMFDGLSDQVDLAAPPKEGNDFLFSMRNTKRSRHTKFDDDNQGTANKKTLKKKEAKKRKKERERQELLEAQTQKAFGSAPSSLIVPRHIQLLSFSRLSVGVKLLAIVRQVNTRNAVLSLPNSLTGHLDLRDVSDYISKLSPANLKEAAYDMKKMFTPGQFVLCAISSLDKSDRKRIEVTTKGSTLNEGLRLQDLGEDLVSQINGHVNSIEDHGYVISLGVKSVTAFLPFTNISSSTNSNNNNNNNNSKKKKKKKRADDDNNYDHTDENNQFIIGQALTVAVKSVNVKARSIICQLTNCTKRNPSSFPTKHIVNKASIGMQSLTPGMLVKATVKKVLKSGLYCTFLTYFGASVDVYHMKKPASSGWVERNVYSAGDTMVARIIMVDNVSKTASLSAAPHVVSLKAKQFSCNRGDVFNRAIIARVDKGTGLLLNCTDYAGNSSIKNDSDDDSGDDSDVEMVDEDKKKITEVAYTHISRVSDSRTENLAKYRDKIVKCRIIGFSEFDGMALASLKESILTAKVLSINDVKPGVRITGRIEKVDEKAVVCSIGENVRGIILPSHLAEVKLQKFDDKFKVGGQVSCRVLQIDTKRKRVLLTCKRILVTSPNEIISNYSEDYVGTLAHGFVTAIKEYGVVVTFYNNVHGLVSIEDMERHGIHEPALAYNLGQSVLCKVLSVQVGNGRMRLSFHTKEDESGKAGAKVLPTKYTVGKVLKSVKIDEIRADSGEIILQFADNITGILNKVHLSDHKENCDSLFNMYSVGDKLKDLVVLEARKIFQRDGLPGWKVILSKKPAILRSLLEGLLPSKDDEMVVDRLLCGYVHNTTAFGIFVRFLGRATVYIPKSNISESFVENTSDFFSAGQTVWTKIIRSVQAPGESAIGTLKPLLCNPWSLSTDYHSMFLVSYLIEIGNIAKHESDEDDNDTLKSIDWESYPIGSIVEAEVIENKKEGVLLSIDDTGAWCQRAHATKAKYKKGSVVKCMILDVDMKNNILHVTLDSKSITVRNKKTTKRFKLDQELDATVLLVKEKYYVVELPNSAHKNTIGFLAKETYNGNYIAGDELEQGDSVEVNVSVTARANNKQYPGRTTLLVFPSDVNEKSDDGNSNSKKLKKKKEIVHRGALLDCVVRDIKKDAIDVEMKIIESEQKRFKASIFLTDIVDLNDTTSGNENVLIKMRSFEVGSEIQARCLWTNSDKSKENKTAVNDDDDAKEIVAQLSLRDSEVSSATSEIEKRLSWRDAENLEHVKDLYGVVLDIVKDGAWIAISPILKGFVYCTNCSYDDDIETLNEDGVKGVLQVGQIVPACVLNVDEANHSLELSLRKIDIENPGKIGGYKRRVGDILIGRTISIKKGGKVKVNQPPAINIQVSKGAYGRVCITHLKDKQNWVDVPFGRKSGKKEKLGMSSLLPGKFVRSVVVKNENDHLDLSMRGTILALAAKKTYSTDTKWLTSMLTEDDSIANFEAGNVVKGYVVETVKVGCFIRLSPSVIARVMITNLSDSFIKHTDKVFYPTKLVTGKILTIDSNTGRVELSLKNSVVKEVKNKSLNDSMVNFKNVEVGQVLEGTVSKVESYGVFIKLLKSGNPGISGMCHISEATDKYVKNLSKLFKAGDLVKTKVIKIDRKEKKISLSLKASNFKDSNGNKKKKDLNKTFDSSSDEDSGSDDGDEDVEMNGSGSTKVGKVKLLGGSSSSEEDSDEDSDDEAEQSKKTVVSNKRIGSADYISSSSDEEEESSSSEDDEDDSDDDDSTEKSKPMFSFKGFDRFTKAADDDSDSSSDSDEDSSDSDDEMNGGKKKKSRSRSSRKKARERRREEAAIVAEEEALLQGNSVPTSVNDFERMILSSPNSSFVWIKYMAFQLSMTEIDLARAIAERALKQINYREIEEKLNVWMAYLNLEYKYGNDKTFEDLFKRALEVNDAIVIHLRMANIFYEANDEEKANEIYKRAIKKYGSKSVAIWTDYGLFAIKTNSRHVPYKNVLSQALQRLPSRESVALISKFAIMEFKYGTPERGRTIFEEILANYPKRVDIWNMYLDQETSIFAQNFDSMSPAEKKKVNRVQRLFNRVISLKFSSKKMKFFFKKYLQFEQNHGTSNGEEQVKKLAREWVQSQ